MEINLNENFTTDDVAKLLASKDDSANRQLRVTKEGIAYLSEVIGNKDIDKLAFRFETWLAGNGYVGKNAASKINYVRKIETALRNNWPKPTSTYLDFY